MSETTSDTKNPTPNAVCAICGSPNCPTGFHDSATDPGTDSSTPAGFHDSSMPTSQLEGDATAQK